MAAAAVLARRPPLGLRPRPLGVARATPESRAGVLPPPVAVGSGRASAPESPQGRARAPTRRAAGASPDSGRRRGVVSPSRPRRAGRGGYGLGFGSGSSAAAAAASAAALELEEEEEEKTEVRERTVKQQAEGWMQGSPLAKRKTREGEIRSPNQERRRRAASEDGPQKNNNKYQREKRRARAVIFFHKRARISRDPWSMRWRGDV